MGRTAQYSVFTSDSDSALFRKLLVANRGEIAVRIIRTARRLGILTVAVYSEVDKDALHVRSADEAICIGPPEAVASYLNIERVVSAAVESGASAIHPGYGFLSENPEFADACAEAGLIFIGPPASAIRAMGLKNSAKRLMEAAGVPVVPGYHGRDQSRTRLQSEAQKIGFPALIKAAAGGGGKGMRIAQTAGEFSSRLAEAKRESYAAFGSDDVIIERLVQCPRHIEVQIFADRHGKVTHLFERDCTLQRRYQKVIEESPAPGISEEFRAAICSAATDGAQAIGYIGAGTMEFIADGSDGLHPSRFWFMEMNTRLQVEHPVTETVLGIDLVEWQIRAAAGQPLDSFCPNELRIAGSAVEARIYAENPANQFLPAAGRLTRFAMPSDVRVDSGVEAGDTVSPYYDPMICKFVARGETREEARQVLASALGEAEIRGIPSNLAFLQDLIDTAEFISAQFDTGTIARKYNLDAAAAVPSATVLALAAIGIFGLPGQNAKEIGFALWQPLNRTLNLVAGNEEKAVEVTVHSNVSLTIRCAKETLCCRFSGGCWRINGESIEGRVMKKDNFVHVFHEGIWSFSEAESQGAAHVAQSGDGTIRAPMPAVVRTIHVQPGDVVDDGQVLVTMEAMKMELTLSAPCGGFVDKVHLCKGAQVTDGAEIISIISSDADRT